MYIDPLEALPTRPTYLQNIKMSQESNLSEGVWIEEIDNQLIKDFAKFTAFKDGFVRFQPSGQIFPRGFASIQKKVNQFTAREDDIWVVSYPKCGTTWTQEMVWNIVNDLDFSTATSMDLERRVPFLEFSGLVPDGQSEQMEIFFADFAASIGEEPFSNSLELAESKTSPRILKTHLCLDMLPRQLMEKGAKIIYVARNPRDTCVSYYHHWKIMAGFEGSWDDFFDAFVGDMCGYYAPFSQHVLGYWEQRKQQNVLFITFEDMKKDLPSVIRKTAHFLNKTLNDEDIAKLAEHLSFNSMKKNKAVNKEDFVAAGQKMQGVAPGARPGEFMRKGDIGDWKSYFTKDQKQRMELWEEANFQDSGFQFVYE